MDALLPFFAILLALVVIFFFTGVKVVPQGHQWTVERFGRYTTTLEPGLNLIIPFVDRVGFRLSMMESVLDVPSQTVISKDNAAVTADGVVFYRIMEASRAAYQVNNLTYAIVNLTITNLRSVLGSMELDHMLSNREEINERLLAAVDQATAPWGIKVTRIEIRDLSMSSELQEAMNLQMTAERHRRAVVTKANGDKEAAILQAQGQREAQVLQAQGEKEAAFLNAEAREREALAEAKATRVVSQAISEGDVQALQYFLGVKYVEALQHIGQGDNSKLVLMPLEASGVTGAVAGITELLKNTQAK
ncbi:MAG: SPFH/Band 7/PHB domain protein [Gammaproteobacteria bacterium]|nr:SPFH/Band 7/PHB domain protein [Gammaproteobacteria bacterium]